MRIFIGFDSRQPLSYTVCRSSIERHAKGRVQIEPLRLDWLPIQRRGLTEFTFARYLVPWLCNFEGSAIYLDGDMLARADVTELLGYALAYPETPVFVVKGRTRFEWPSVMVFNNAHCEMLTPHYVNDGLRAPQSLSWAREVRDLPKAWNHLVGYDAPNPDAKLVHFTAGIPCWPETKDCEFAEEWRQELAQATKTCDWETLMGKSVHREIVKPEEPKPKRHFEIGSQCAVPLDGLYTHIRHALTLQLPVCPQAPAHDQTIVLVGSGPSLASQLPAIRAEINQGRSIVAIKGAHDYLIERGIFPHYALCIDPTESQYQYFSRRRHDVKYLIASQCHPRMFTHLTGYDVCLFHCYVAKGQREPPDTDCIMGGTTSGLRAMALFYTMGYRSMRLYGYDSCVAQDRVRLGRNLATEDESTRYEIVVNDKSFLCTPALTAQAKEFQEQFTFMPDLHVEAFGDGLIQEIMKVRNTRPLRTMSFLHHGGPAMASYRYRCAMPAAELGASINDLSADVLIVSKPESVTIPEIKQALGKGQSVIVDFCDDHFDQLHYRECLRLADAVTCSTEVLKRMIEGEFKIAATVIPEPYEFPDLPPHCRGKTLLWFGSGIVRPHFGGVFGRGPFQNTIVRMVSNHPEDISWSRETMLRESAQADFVLMPTTAAYKSANRAVEAIRRGCFVVAEPHPSLTDIPGIWIGDMQEGLEWAASHLQEANERIRTSQIYVLQTYSPRTVAYAWSQVIRDCPSTWGQVSAPGPIGSMSISQGATAVPTSEPCHSPLDVPVG